MTYDNQIILQIIEGSPIATFAIDKSHIVIYWNKACENLTGINARNIIGTKRQWLAFYKKERPVIADLVLDKAGEEDVSKYYGDKCHKSTLIEGSYICEDFFPNIGKSGKWFLFTTAPIRDNKGKIIGAVETLQDITKQKQADEALEIERRFSNTIIQAAPVYFVAIGGDGKTITMNKTMLDEMGYTLDEIRGKDYLTTFVPKRDHKMLSDIFKQLVKSNKSTLNENYVITKNGREILLEWHGRPVFKEEGKFDFFFGLGLDITERERTYEQIRHLNRLLRTVSSINQLLVHERDKKRLLKNICQNIITSKKYTSAWIILFDREGKYKMFAQAGIDKYSLSLKAMFKENRFNRCIKRALSKSGVIIIRNVYKECIGCPLFKKDIKESSMSIRLDYKGITYGVISIDMVKYSVIDREEQDLIKELAEDIAFVLHNMELEREKEEIERTLKESEERFSTFMYFLPASVFIKDKKSHNLYFNRYTEGLFGADEGWIGKSTLEVIKPKEVAKQMIEDDKKALSEGYFMSERAIFDKNNIKHIYQTHKFPIVQKDGSKLLGGFALDITERKMAEERINKHIRDIELLSETAMKFIDFPLEEDLCKFIGEQLRAIIGEKSIIAINLIDRDNNVLITRAIIGIERLLARIIKISGKDPVGLVYNAKDEYLDNLCDGKLHCNEKGLYEILLKTVPKSVCVSIEKLINIGNIYTIGLTKGEQLFGTVVIILQKGEQDLENMYVVEAFIKQASMAIQKGYVENKLRESKDIYRTLVENNYDAVCICMNYTMLFANKKTFEITGYKQEELLNINTLDLIHPEDRERVKKIIVGRIKKKGESTIFDARIVRKDNNERWCEIALESIPYKGKHAIMVILRDITNYKKMQEEIIRNEKLDSLGILAGGIAHDFNNFLTIIMGSCSLLMVKMKGNTEITDMISDVEKATERAKRLTQQLLTFARGGAPVKEVASIVGIVRDSAEFVLRGSKSKCEFLISDNLYSVNVDAGQISQVIQNVVLNANQAMPEGGTIMISIKNKNIKERGKITFKTVKYIKISIKDQGVGIPGKHLTKIFDPFFTTKQAGSGLGLATSYSIIKNHSGHIEVQSDLGKGATFCIYLPAQKKQEEKGKEKKYIFFKEGGKVLIMDDEKGVRELSRKILNNMGFDVDLAINGEEAINKYMKAMDSENFYDIVIMDLTIPGGMGGEKAVKELLKLDPDAKVVVSSGYSTDPIISNYKDYGFKGCLSKPYNIDELSEVLEKLFS